MATEAEAEVHAAVTAAWVNSDALTVALSRQTKTATTSGGNKVARSDLAPQTFRMDRYSAGSVSAIATPDGLTIPKSFRLVGPVDADVQRGDTFVVSGAKYEVIHIHRESFERVAAEVEYRG